MKDLPPIQIHYATSLKFNPPPMLNFSILASLMSAISLLLMALVSVAGFVSLNHLPTWVLAPFLFIMIGSTLGFLFETTLLLIGKPFQLQQSVKGRFIQKLRLANLAFVFGTLYLATCFITISASPVLLTTLIVGIGLIVGTLLIIFLFDGPPQIAGSLIISGLVGQTFLIVISSTVPGETPVRILFVLQSLTMLITVLLVPNTPAKSTLYHVLGAGATGLLWGAFYIAQSKEGSFFVYENNFPLLLLMIGVAVGMSLSLHLFPKTYGKLRSYVSNATWPFFYLLIAGGLRPPAPANLSKLYGDGEKLKPLKIFPYYIAHPRNLSYPLSVPCLDEKLTPKIIAFGWITKLVKILFAVASIVSRIFPFANIKVPLKDKPRMKVWSNGSEYWPWWLLKKISLPFLGPFSIESGVRGPGFQNTPDQAIQKYQQGQLLAYLVEYGMGGTYLSPVNLDGKNLLKLDLSFLEKYETKPDYESYGGIAFFEFNSKEKRLELIAVTPPNSSVKITANPNDPSFRHAEDMITASLYFHGVSSKHLVGIHMGFNLVEVAMFNAFDLNHQWLHPIRLALYPHFFAHELAEELTTQHLLEDGEVFPQIFATTNASLMRHLNDSFSAYKLGEDEDFEYREKVLKTVAQDEENLADTLPNASLVWEKEYFSLWRKYTKSIVFSVYDTDSAVAEDIYIQKLFHNLEEIFLNKLPNRYTQLKTKEGLSIFMSDVMHHLIIQHEVYGTSSVRLALDPRINNTQVPRDGGTPSIEEWRSLACVAMATSRVRYTKLNTDFKDVFDDIENPALKEKLRQAHDTLKEDLRNLETKWKNDGVDNYGTLRLLPSDLDIGAGY